MTIYETTDDGEIRITFDSRWKNPEVFGFKPSDPQYKLLRRLWEEITGYTEEINSQEEKAFLPSD